MNPKNVMVTGGAGFIGSHLSHALFDIQSVNKIIIIDNLLMSSLDNIKEIVAANRVEFIKGDVCDYNLMAFLLNKYEIDTVYHLAVSPLVLSLKEPNFVIDNIVGMQKTILECQRKGFFRKLISFSTSEVYGSSDERILDENSLMYPETPYAAAKASCDHLIHSYKQSFDIDYTIIRLFNNYGQRKEVFTGRAGIIPTTIKLLSKNEPVPIYGNGDYARDFTFVEDTINAVINASDNPKAKGELFVIASGIAISIKQVVLDIARLMNVDPRIDFRPNRQGDVSYLCGNSDKASKLLGFQQNVGWEEGIKRCIEYYGIR